MFLDKLVSKIRISLEKEYLFYEVFENGEDTKQVYSDFFISTPKIGEMFVIPKNEKVETFLVLGVVHSADRNSQGYIYIKRTEPVYF